MQNEQVRRRPDTTVAFLSYGFRPFFFFGALYAATNMLLWLPFYFADIEMPIVVSAIDWHIHELVFGVLPAIVAGFLLTAVPNWTGRLPVRGLPLLMLVLIWVAGRLAFNFSAYVGLTFIAIVDCAFLATLLVAVANEIIAGKNWKNLRVLVIVGLLTLGHIAFYVEISIFSEADYARRIGFTAVALLIMLIGGRIIPSFTRNWLTRAKPGRLPIPFNSRDKIVLAISAIALLGWVAAPNHVLVGFTLCAAALANLWRLSRWAGDRAASCYLLVILHLAYLFLVIGLMFIGTHIISPSTIPQAAGIHAIGMGCFGAMVLGVMVRATRGHTGHALQTDLGAQIAFTLVLLAATIRVLAALDVFADFNQILLQSAQLGWCLAFLSFAVSYAPKLFSRRKS